MEDKNLLKPVMLFDLLINNADRKGSHVFFENETHKLYAIDHGVCFHEENKLRTVIWDFAGQAIPDELLAPLFQADGWSALFANYLSLTEVVALQNRAERLLTSRTFPQAPRDRRTSHIHHCRADRDPPNIWLRTYALQTRTHWFR
ncbi:hypothetical protein [Candidatus Villigracilis saccharophilus]|uniref:hypothetical protein n=1 Tax=Candidatus Villigracilis saccharophilus TaxID=3140684 RepID=UPI0031359EF5|nr:hypothetical protein [Anaerolineales bacterium]